MGRDVGGYVRPNTGAAVAAFGLDWFAFARPVWGGFMEARDDR